MGNTRHRCVVLLACLSACFLFVPPTSVFIEAMKFLMGKGQENQVSLVVRLFCACLQEKVSEERVQGLKQRFMSAYDATADGRLQIQEVAHHLSRIKSHVTIDRSIDR